MTERLTIYQGDALETLRQLPDESVQTCVTSPPYFGLRNYGHDGQIGLEPTPDEFVQALVKVFQEVRRVLRDDGTVWLNLGDSYAGGGGGNYNKTGVNQAGGQHITNVRNRSGWLESVSAKPKDLLGIPWRVAFALKDDGWYLRQDIIWHKPNPMPESVTDRCTKAHEYLFLLSKSPKYYYDHEAIKEPVESVQPPRRFGRKEYEKAQSENGHEGAREIALSTGQGTDTTSGNHYGRVFGGHETRNKRSVWTVSTKPYSGAHFATFPPDLIRPCILAGAPEGGVVLDPFGGSGTTAEVALQHQRRAILCELNPEYVKLIEKRLAPLLAQPSLFPIPTEEVADD